MSRADRDQRRHSCYVAAYTERFGRAPLDTPDFTPRRPEARP